MATYIALSSFTDQGIRNVKDTTKRAEAVKEAGRKLGVEMKELYWTLGQYDLVAILEAPDEKAITALALSIGASGSVRTQTMPAFTRDEMNTILAKMA